MEANLRSTLDWFRSNLDLLIEDIELQSLGTRQQLFFDTNDVAGALLGMQFYDYHPKNGFQVYPFFGYPSTLVQALLGAGWLGSFEMLTPHQAEFLHGLNVDFRVERFEYYPEARMVEFMQALAASGWRAEPTCSLSKMSASELLRFVRGNAKHAADVFKTIQCIREAWRLRLTYWRRRRLLEVSDVLADSVYYTRMLSDPFVRRLKSAFDARRRGRDPANLADAIALSQLRDLVSRHRSDSRADAPRLFASAPVWKEAIHDSGAADEFTYINPEGKQSTAVRDRDYYIFRALYLPERRWRVDDPEHKPLFATAEEIRWLRDEVDSILLLGKPLSGEVIQGVTLGERPLSDVLDEVKCFSFFENVWLPYLAEGEAKRVLRYLDPAARQLTQARFRTAVIRAVEATRRDLEVSVNEYERVAALWEILSRSLGELADRIAKVEPSLPFVNRDLGLIRFALSPTTIQNVRAFLIELRTDRQGEGNPGRMIQAILAANEMEKDEVLSVAALLWTIGLDEYTVDLLSRSGLVEGDLAAAGLRGAALFRMGKDLSRARSVVKDLEGRLSQLSEGDTGGDLRCLLAYLVFRLWRATGGATPWRTAGPGEAESRRLRILRKSAVSYAKSVWDAPTLSHEKRIWGLNQYLFYLVETEPLGEGLEAMKAGLSELLEFREEDRSLWCFRYDDTIARFFHRRANEASNEVDHANFFREAVNYSRAAVEESRRWNRRVHTYHTRLLAEAPEGLL